MLQQLSCVLIEVVSASLLFSIGVPAFIFQNSTPELLKPVLKRRKLLFMAPIVVLTVSYLVLLLFSLVGALGGLPEKQGSYLLAGSFFVLACSSVCFWLFVYLFPGWEFFRRFLSPGRNPDIYWSISRFDDFVVVAMHLARSGHSDEVLQEFKDLLPEILKSPDYRGNGLDRFFGALTAIYIAQEQELESVDGLFDVCKTVFKGTSKFPESESSDFALALGFAEGLARRLINRGRLMDFARAVDMLSISQSNLGSLLWSTVEQRAQLEFSLCLSSLSSSLGRWSPPSLSVCAHLCVVAATIDRDPTWVSPGSQSRLEELLEAQRAVIKAMSVADVFARISRIRDGEANLRRHVARILRQLELGKPIWPSLDSLTGPGSE